jgi:predicted permease
MLHRFRSLWRNIVHRGRVERDLEDELRSVFEQLVAEKTAAGMAPADAQRQATRELGRVESLKLLVRESRTGAGLETLWTDVRFGVRLLRRSPAFAAAVIVSLALGIGANTAVFGLLNAVRLRSLPVPRADELAEIRLEGPRCCRHTGRNRQVSLPLWQEIVKRQQAFASLFAFADTRFNLAPRGEVRYVEGLFVSGEFFPVLGVPAALGRTIGAADDHAGCVNPGAVISDSLWRSDFGRRPDVLSQTLTLRGGQHPIIGVMPAGFFGVEAGRRFDVALPLCASTFHRHDHWWLAVMGRLAPGWTAEQVNAHIGTLAPALLAAATPPQYTANQARDFVKLRMVVHPGANGISPLRTQYEDPLWFLLLIAGLVLLTACANVASLSLVRATSREAELTLRFALGATKLRVIRQLMIEGALLALAATAAGLVLARFAQDAVMAALSTRTDPIILDVSPDLRILAFTALMVFVTTIAFAVLPAVRASRGAQVPISGARTTWSRERTSVRELLLGMQVAMSVVLASAALLFALTMRNLSTMDLGFNRDDVLVANVFLVEEEFSPATRAAAVRDLTQRLGTIPGVTGVAHAATPPLGGSFWGIVARTRGPAGEITAEANRNQVSTGYFTVMGTRLIAGRDFTSQDTPLTPLVAIVNETFARTFFGNRPPIGERFTEGDRQFEVVGLAADSKLHLVRENFRPIAYTAASQAADLSSTIRYLLRAPAGADTAIESVRRTLVDFSPSAAVRFATVRSMVSDGVQREWLLLNLSGFFGLIAIALALVGVYGIVSYTASSRQREIGIRVALGARAADVIRTVLGRVAVVSGAGLLVGSVLTLSVSAAAKSYVFGVEPGDPVLLMLIVAVITIAAAAAAAAPVRRALHTDPVVSLKAE